MGNGKVIEDLLAKGSALGSLVLDEFMEEKESLLESALNSPIGDRSNLRVKKLLAAALHVAASKGQPIGVDAKPLSIAPLVDEAFSRLKAGVLVKAGKLDVYEAADALIDRATARLIVITDRVIAKVPLATDALVKAVAVYFPPIEVVAPLIKNLARRLTPICQEKAREGIQHISTYAKNAVRTVATKTIPIIRRIKKALFA